MCMVKNREGWGKFLLYEPTIVYGGGGGGGGEEVELGRFSYMYIQIVCALSVPSN